MWLIIVTTPRICFFNRIAPDVVIASVLRFAKLWQAENEQQIANQRSQMNGPMLSEEPVNCTTSKMRTMYKEQASAVPMTNKHYLESYLQLNEEQKNVVDFIRQHCGETIDAEFSQEPNPKNPSQLLLFITGPGRTGKSHTIYDSQGHHSMALQNWTYQRTL